MGKTTIPRRVGVITNLNFLSTVMEYILSNEYLCVCTYVINKLNCRVWRAVVLNRIDQGYCALPPLNHYEVAHGVLQVIFEIKIW